MLFTQSLLFQLNRFLPLYILHTKREGSPTEDVRKLLSEGLEDASGSRDSTDEDIVLAEYVSEDESTKNERYYRQERYPSNMEHVHVDSRAIWELCLHNMRRACFVSAIIFTKYCSIPKLITLCSICM